MALTIQFVPYHEIEDLGSARRVKKLIDLVKENKIVLLQGRLKKEQDFLKKARNNFFGFLLGDRQGFTIIGPATVVKEIKKDPNKIELYAKEPLKKRKSK